MSGIGTPGPPAARWASSFAYRAANGFSRRTVRDDAEQHGDGDDGDGAIRSGAAQFLKREQREHHRHQAPATEPGVVFVTFVFTTLIHEPASIAALLGILLLSVALDLGWKDFHDTRTKNVQIAH
jgi:hypothetical protein